MLEPFPGVQLLQLRECLVRNLKLAAAPAIRRVRGAVERVIVQHYQRAVLGVMIVELDHVRAGRHAALEGGQRILRCHRRIPAMRDDERAGGGEQLMGGRIGRGTGRKECSC